MKGEENNHTITPQPFEIFFGLWREAWNQKFLHFTLFIAGLLVYSCRNVIMRHTGSGSDDDGDEKRQEDNAGWVFYIVA